MIFTARSRADGTTFFFLKTPTPNLFCHSPCGGGQQPATAPTTWVVGQQVTFNWLVIAGDGAGTVELWLDDDSTNALNFTTLIGTFPANEVSTTPYTYTWTVPDIKCGGNRCTIQAKVITNEASGSGWFSCATVNIVPPGTPIPRAFTPLLQFARAIIYSLRSRSSNMQNAR